MILQWKSLALAESHYEIMEKLSKMKEENKNLKKEIHEVNQLNSSCSSQFECLFHPFLTKNFKI